MPDLSELERQVNQDREKLTDTLNDISETLSPDRVASKLNASIEGYGGELGRQVWDTARQNPAALALVAAGLGLLMTGTGTPGSASRERLRATRYQSSLPDATTSNFDARVATADAKMRAGMASDTAAPDASWLRANLENGLDALPESARRRVMNARKAAIRAQEKVERQAAGLARKSRSFHGKQPLATGAVALGLGALIGALLPSTRRENQLLGRHRDALMAEAQSALQAEMDKIKGAVRDGVDAAANSVQPQESSSAVR